MTEYHLQKSYVEWFRMQYPDLQDVCFAIPNGGGRDAREGYKLKLSGVLSGVPDMQLCFASPPFHGLFTEFKFGDNTLTENQHRVCSAMSRQNYDVHVCYDLDNAIGLTTNYIQGMHDNHYATKTRYYPTSIGKPRTLFRSS